MSYTVIFAFVAVLTLAFLVSAKSRARARFSYGESSAQTTTERRPDGCYLVHETAGVVRNHSTEANSLESLHLVCWWRGRNGAVLFTGNPAMVKEAGVESSLPLRFEAKSSRAFVLRWEVRIDEPANEMQNRRYEVALRDSEKRLFDDDGRLKNWRNIERLRRFTESVHQMPSGATLPLMRTALTLRIHKMVFVAQRLLWRIGF